MERIVFMGTPEFAVASLRTLYEHGLDIGAVITAPDKPAGRGQVLSFSPVKQYVLDKIGDQTPLLQPDNLKDPVFLNQLGQIRASLFVVVAFRMLPPQVWQMPALGTINLHASLLPLYRGAAPIQWALINGEQKTGLTTFFINENIDTGNIIDQREVEILPGDNAGSLHDRMKEEGAQLLLQTVLNVLRGQAKPLPQENLVAPGSQLKKAPKILREHTRINWSSGAVEIANLIRGLSPRPGAWDELQLAGGKKLLVRILAARPLSAGNNNIPGRVRADRERGIIAETGDGQLQILELQVAGKKKQGADEFLSGYSVDGGRFLNHSSEQA